MILIPAYGRRYFSIEEALEQWKSGVDFRIFGGPYCSIRDLENMKKDFSIIELACGPVSVSERVTIWDADPLANYVPTTCVEETP